MTLNEITLPVKDNLEEFNRYFRQQMKSEVPLLNLIINYMTQKKGKQVRPTLVFLTAELCGGINERTYKGATLVELLHNATLVHDDVVDEATVRRGIASINANWNNKIAVLIGDFLLAKGLLTAIDNNEFEFLKATSHAVRRMSEGELLQIQKSREFDLTEDVYFKIISNKTASLMAACCEIGAISATEDVDKQLLMREFGETLGIAFQIRDDIFDYLSKNSIIGKPAGNDLKERKMTLPLIYAINNVSKKESKEIISVLKKDDITKKDINRIISFVKNNGGIEYSEQIAKNYSNKAIELLKDFPDLDAKSSLIEFCRFVVERKK